jgi:hypothetical protein
MEVEPENTPPLIFPWPTPHAALERNNGERFFIQMQIDGTSGWFFAADVCDALNLSRDIVLRLPAHVVRKVTTPNKRRAWGLSTEGLLMLIGTAHRNSTRHKPSLSLACVETLDTEGNTTWPAEDAERLLAWGARASIEAAMLAYPQKNRKKTPQAGPLQSAEGEAHE